MKKLKITTIIFLSAAAICLCAMMIILLSSDGRFSFGGGDQNYSLVLEKEFDTADIKSLEIDYGMNSNDVLFYEGTGESIVIREYLNFKPNENQISTVKQDGTKLQIKGSRRNSFFFFSFRPRNSYTEIYLPADFAEKLDSLYVKTLSGDVNSELSFALQDSFSASSTSGDITFPEVKAHEIQFHSTSGVIYVSAAQCEIFSASTTSGDIQARQVAGKSSVSSVSGEITLGEQSGDITISTTSGDIFAEQVTGEALASSVSGEIFLKRQNGDVEASSTSGDIRVGALQGNFEMDSSSGEVQIADGTGQGRADTISGDVQIYLTQLTGGLNISTTSGWVNLRLPETVSLTLDFDSTSGECGTFFDDRLSFNKKGNKADGQYGGGAHKVRISTTSGDLRISEY